MPLLLLFGFFLYIYVEISLLVSVGSAIGILPLIALMIAISVVGLWLVKLRGLLTLNQIRKQLGQGQLPTQAVISSLFFAMAGGLLLIPGFLSDILAILLLLPITRSLLQGVLLRVLKGKFRFLRAFQSAQTSQTQTFEAEFERKADEDKWLK